MYLTFLLPKECPNSKVKIGSMSSITHRSFTTENDTKADKRSLPRKCYISNHTTPQLSPESDSVLSSIDNKFPGMS